MLIASHSGEIVFVNTRDFSVQSKTINLGVCEISDLKATQDGQWLLVSYTSGAVNLHALGDRSLDFIM